MSRSLHEKSNHDKVSSFFSELSSSIRYSSIFDSELNRRLAHEFNIFDFLRDDEIGLSRIIAHLFNPLASHGQGTFFLQHFLKLVKNEKNWNHLDSQNVNVETEHSTFENRRIDIYVEILGEMPFVLAIENKPYARDQKNQVLHYLEYLNEKFSKEKTSDFLLVYLSSDGEGPSESSFPQKGCNRWKEKFTVMAYAESGDDPDESQDTEDESSNDQHDEENQHVESLATWFKICKKECDVDRLRWILGDAENFCTKTFGISKSTDDVEVQVVKSFLYKNPSFINTAYAVNKAWPSLVKEVSKNFLTHITAETKKRIVEKYPDRNDLQVDCRTDFEKGYIYMYLFSKNWIPYENGWSDTNGKYYIIFCNDRKNKPDWWFVGVQSPTRKEYMNDDAIDRREQIQLQLNRKISGSKSYDWFDPAYKYVDSEKENWEPILETLLDECKLKLEKGEDSKFTKYYVDFFWKFADISIEILDDIEKAS